ncbi:hypothetical protein D3C85_1508270 [compost metagenome]
MILETLCRLQLVDVERIFGDAFHAEAVQLATAREHQPIVGNAGHLGLSVAIPDPIFLTFHPFNAAGDETYIERLKQGPKIGG